MLPIPNTGGKPQADPHARWLNIPLELRQRPQWCISPGLDDDKAPRSANGRLASSTSPGTWADFSTACSAAAEREWHVGYMLHESDPFACIDLDVKDGTSAEHLARFDMIKKTLDSYTERSRSGQGWHVWVKSESGPGCKRDGVEVYTRERFIICTGETVLAKPIADRQELVAKMISQMRPVALPDTEFRPDHAGDDLGCCIAGFALEDAGELGRLMRGEWEMLTETGVRKFPSQSEADFALLLMLARLTESNEACRQAFRLSMLGRREKAKRDDRYLNLTLRKVRPIISDEAYHISEGGRIAGEMFWPEARTPSPLTHLRVDWETDEDSEVPDMIEGLVADEEVTLLGGHGGIGKGFLALQMAAAVATGSAVLHRPAQQCRVLYYSAEDGRKRLTRRLRSLIETHGFDPHALRDNLLVLDASELEPLYGEALAPSDGKRPTFIKMLGPRADFENLQRAVEEFDAQFVIVDGASDTFDGNEIARREVRAFIKLLRRVHPQRPVGVLLNVHIDRSSARGNTTNDDGYAGSAQWHNSCRRRLFLQQEVKREKDELTDEWEMVPGNIKLRVMKNQDGPPDPDMVLSRGEYGFWRVGSTDLTALLPQADQPDHSPALLQLIADYYDRAMYMSTSLAPQATAGVFATLKNDPDFPRGLTKKRTDALIRDLQRKGALIVEQYRRPNRGLAERWAVGTLAATPLQAVEAQCAPS